MACEGYMRTFDVPVAYSETLARYIFSRKYLGPEHPKAAAFLPPSDMKLSLFRIDGLSESGVWDIGFAVGGESHRHLHGRGDLVASQISAHGLQTDPDNIPERHVNATGWPTDASEQLSIAQELANSAVSRVAPGEAASSHDVN